MATSHLLGQEICNNGIDDDGDGFIDCYDNECAGNTACSNFFVGTGAICEDPPNVTNFAMQELWRTDKTKFSFWGSNHTIVGDIDFDGIPEIFAVRRDNRNGVDPTKIVVVNGNDGTLKAEVDIGGDAGRFMALADIEGDGCGEVFFVRKAGAVYRLVAIDCNFNIKWESADIAGTTSNAVSVGIPGVADFDEDGTPEVYVKTQIFDGATGAFLARGTGDHKQHTAGSVAANVLPDSECGPCDGLELIAGDKVYAVSTGDGSPNSGTVSLVRTLSSSIYKAGNNFINNTHSTNIHFTSIADVDLDGDLDAIITGYNTSSGRGEIYYWDIQNETEAFKLVMPKSSNWGPGRVNISDLDGDGDMDISFNNNDLYAYTFDFDNSKFVQLWTRNHNDGSALTGTAVFDFDGNGSNEVVYRDERNLYIIDGATGNELFVEPDECRSGTYADYPIVADVNGDGVTEICVPCLDECPSGPCYNSDNQGSLRLYGAADGQQWVPSRKVWNQHGYFNVNINDDLTIPRQMQDHSVEFSDVLCETDANGNPVPGSVRPLNSFLNQAPFIDEDGCLAFPVSDITFVNNSLTITSNPTCPDTDIGISFKIVNNGDLAVSGDIPITFYNGDPEIPSSEKLNTVIFASSVPVGDTILFTTTAIGTGGSFELYMVVNDDGSQFPGINYPSSAVLEECDYSNNVASINISPEPFTLSALVSSPNLKCEDTLSTNTGEVSAFVLAPDGVTQVTTGYTFYWFDGPVAAGTADFTGPVYAGLEDGFYTVVAINNDKGCGSDTVSLEVTRLATDASLSARIDEVSVNTSCTTPNGELKVIVKPTNNSDVVGDNPNLYNFSWEQSTGLGSGIVISQTEVATGIASGLTYTVRVTDKATGCSVLSTLDSTGTGVIFPIARVDIAKDNNFCVGGNGFGRVSVGGDTTNFDFSWFDNEWKPAADYNFASRSNMVGGEYYIIAEAKSSGCADSLSFSIGDSLIYPSLNLFESIPNRSCDPSKGTGQLTVVSAENIAFSCCDPVNGNTDNFTIAGDASIIGTNRFQLTPDANTKSGATWFNDKISLNNDFIFDFLINLGARNESGADGISFSFQNDPSGRFAYGLKGQGMGAQNLDPGLAIEFDTWENGGFGDLKEDHIAVLNTLDYGNPLFGPITMDDAASNFEDGNDHTVRISWTAASNRLQVILDGNSRIDETYDMVNQIFGGDEYVFFGFTASTGGALNDQQIELVNIVATILEPDSNVGIEWFDGPNSSVSLNGGAFDGDSIANALSDGFYRVKAVSNITGCATEADYEVEDDTETPVIDVSLIDMTPNANCDTALAAGILSVRNGAVSEPPKTGVISNSYNFQWWEGSNDIGAPDFTGQTINGLLQGTYTLVATNDSTSCPSDPVQVTVTDDKDFPVITFTDSSYQTHCDPSMPNGFAIGQAQMGASAEPASGYTYAFYDGQTTNMAALINNDSSIFNRTEGFYTLFAKNNGTGCESTAEIFIQDSLIDPIINRNNVALTNWTNCNTDSYNGIVAAGLTSVANSNGGSYSFSWFNGPNASGGVNQADSVYGSLSDGDYTLVVTSDSTGCISAPETFTLIQEVTYPNSSVAKVQQHSCDPTNPNGSLTASALEDDGTIPTSGYAFEWFLGQNTLPTSRMDSASLSDSLAIGTYTLMVTNRDNLCTDTTEWSIQDSLFNPVINDDLVVVSAMTVCNPANGSIEASGGVSQPVWGDPVNGYTYQWFNGDSTVVWERDSTVLTSLYSGLETGEYSLTVLNNDTRCVSDESTFEILDSTTTIDILRTDIIIANTCFGSGTPATGELAYQASTSPPNVNGFNFDWFRGREPFTNPVAFSSFTGLTSTDTSRIDTLSSDLYTIRVSNLDDGCVRDTTFFLERNEGHQIVWDSTVNSTLCPDPVTLFGNGQLWAEIEIDPVVQGFGIDRTDYLYELYKGPNVLGSAQADSIFSTTVDSALDTNALFTHLAPGTYTFIIRENNAAILPDACPSKPLTFEIEQDVPNPVLALTSTPDISCVDSLATGQLAVNINSTAMPNAGYNIGWYIYNPTDSVSGGALNTANSYFIDRLIPAEYLVYVFDSTTNCESRSVGKVADEPATITLDMDTYAVIQHDQNCSPANGSIRIDSLLVDGVVTDTAGHWFVWYENDEMTPLAGADSSGFQTNLSEGTYLVDVVSLINGCKTVRPVQQQLINTSKEPKVVIELVSDDNFCSGTGNGIIRAAVDSAGTLITAGYSYQWFEGKDATGIALAANDTLTNLNGGFYTVVVTDTNSPGLNCAGTATFELKERTAAVSLDLSDMTITSQQNCSPADGAIQINAVREDGDPKPLTNYTFAWQTSTGAPLPGAGTGNQVSDLSAGTYQVIATNTVTNCPSKPKDIPVKDITTVPIIEYATTADASCTNDPFLGTGTLQVSVVEGGTPGFVNGYNFTFYYGDSTTNAVPNAQVTVGTDIVTLGTLGAGEYTVVITDTTSPNLACSFSATTIVLEEDIDLPQIQGFSITDQTSCSPVNGRISVDGVDQSPVLGLTFNWYEDSFDPANLVPGLSLGEYNDISAGEYFVTVFNEDTRCLSQVYEATVEDATTPPVVRLDNFTLPFRCANDDGTGILTASGDGSTNTTDYSFEWFAGSFPLNGAALSNQPSLTGQTDGIYSVRVTNLTTLCVDSAEYQLVDEILDVPLFAFASPRSNCITTDGVLTSYVELSTNTDGLNYTFDWSNVSGAVFNSGSALAGNNYTVFGRDIGRYTVVATDNSDPFCVSEPVEIEITDTRFDPDIVITEDQVVTYCVNPNGQFTATVDGGVNGYEFEWFAGTNTSGISPIFTGNVVQGLEGNNTYTVKVTNVVNDCDATLSAVATDSVQPVPTVTATVLAQNTSCLELNPNGTASVSINGELDDYFYFWYEGSNVTVAPFNRGRLVSKLFDGQYSVTAQDRVTGCISTPDQITIVSQISHPEFDLEVVPATCSTDDGLIRLTMVSQKTIQNIIWDDGFQIFNGAVLSNKTSGNYTVSVIDADGCVTTETASIPTDIQVYNSVTPNGDGKNDEFFVGCLDEFENNLVKIYNRSGAQVFESTDYGRTGQVFSGIGNMGVYLGQQELPEGTYFYIIEKNNGEEPVTGYLELIR